ncbi:hypothetical protein CB1_001223001 [Camelus ferus]|nr:hypothetical protein CB1_001223001 [Camelus ferus]
MGNRHEEQELQGLLGLVQHVAGLAGFFELIQVWTRPSSVTSWPSLHRGSGGDRRRVVAVLRHSGLEASPAAGKDSIQAKTSSGRYWRRKQRAATSSTQAAQASDRDPSAAEAEEGAAKGSGLGPIFWPPPNTHPVGSQLMMLTGPQATRGLEEPSPGPSLPEGASTGEEELRGRGAMPRRGVRRVQPIFRIIYTAPGGPQEGSTLEPLRQKGRGGKEHQDCKEKMRRQELQLSLAGRAPGYLVGQYPTTGFGSPEVPVDPGRVSLLPGPPPLGPATCPELRAPRLCSLWPSVVSSTSAVSE